MSRLRIGTADVTAVGSEQHRYLSIFQDVEETLASGGPDWLHDMRRGAAEQFSRLGFPTARRANERWKYTNVAPIARGDFGIDIEGRGNGVTLDSLVRCGHLQEDQTTLVFVDGRYSRELSTSPERPNGVRIATVEEAARSHEALVRRHLGSYAAAEDGFTALNTAFLQEGAFVHIPSGTTLAEPVDILFLSTGGEDARASFPRVLVIAEAESRATIIESYVGLGAGRCFTNSVAEIVVGEGAEVEHYRVLAESENAFHVGAERVHQGAGSTFRSHAFEKGPALGRYDLGVHIDGPEARCDLQGLYVTTGSQHMDNLINIDHAKPCGASRLYYKGILDDSSRAVFGGTVLVRRDAQKTDAQQSDKNLVLSPDAEVDSKPALFIYADDVKCGHGATAGNIDRDTVFYMRSRGLDPETASRLLIYGFASEIIDTVRVERLKRRLEGLFLDSLPSHTFEL